MRKRNMIVQSPSFLISFSSDLCKLLFKGTPCLYYLFLIQVHAMYVIIESIYMYDVVERT